MQHNGQNGSRWLVSQPGQRPELVSGLPSSPARFMRVWAPAMSRPGVAKRALPVKNARALPVVRCR
jgi:hypothetical protein